MTKFEQIQKMRLDHANRCCDPPKPGSGRKPEYDQQLSKHSEKEVIESPDELFRMLSNGNY